MTPMISNAEFIDAAILQTSNLCKGDWEQKQQHHTLLVGNVAASWTQHYKRLNTKDDGPTARSEVGWLELRDRVRVRVRCTYACALRLG